MEKNQAILKEIKITDLKIDRQRLRKRVKADNDELSSVFYACLEECEKVLDTKAVYMAFDISIDENYVNFGSFRVKSEALCENLSGCSKAVLMGATIGVGIDRLILKYSQISPLKALFCQNIGAEFVEMLCDEVCKEIEKEYMLFKRPRFSPGYADLPLEIQKDIFKILGLEKKCGITLTDSFIMRPSKSVTAFMGLGKEKCKKENKCSKCYKSDCEYRNDKQ